MRNSQSKSCFGGNDNSKVAFCLNLLIKNASDGFAAGARINLGTRDQAELDWPRYQTGPSYTSICRLNTSTRLPTDKICSSGYFIQTSSFMMHYLLISLSSGASVDRSGCWASCADGWDDYHLVLPFRDCAPIDFPT